MPAFRYEAVDAAGRPRRGFLDAASARAARDALRGDGLFPTAVEVASRSAGARTDATHLAPPLEADSVAVISDLMPDPRRSAQDFLRVLR